MKDTDPFFSLKTTCDTASGCVSGTYWEILSELEKTRSLNVKTMKYTFMFYGSPLCEFDGSPMTEKTFEELYDSSVPSSNSLRPLQWAISTETLVKILERHPSIPAGTPADACAEMFEDLRREVQRLLDEGDF